MSIKSEIQKIAEIDLFKEVRKEVDGNDYFVGQTFKLDFDKALVAVADARKQAVKGIPHGTFLLAFYEGEDEISEALLLRALGPTKLPTDDDVVRSMLEYYKDNVQVSGEDSKLDQFTRYEFSYSGLECRVLGTFYKNNEGKVVFGADVENFYSPHHYRVYKPVGRALEKIINYRELAGNIADDLRLGKLRYSSTRRFQEALDDVVFYVSPDDYLGKRTALFGMTRTGKSNTVKKIIEATVSVSKQAKNDLKKLPEDAAENLKPLEETGIPKYRVYVSGITGVIEARMNGGLIMVFDSQLKGKSKLETNGGHIYFDGQLDQESTTTFESNGGIIDVALPANASFNLNVQGIIGSFITNFANLPAQNQTGIGEVQAQIGQGPRSTLNLDVNGTMIVLKAR